MCWSRAATNSQLSDSSERPAAVADAASDAATRGRALLRAARSLALPGLLAFFVGSVVGQFLVEDQARERLPRDVFVLGRDLSGWERERAREQLRALSAAAAERELTLDIDQQSVPSRAAELGIAIDADKTLAAVLARREKPIVSRFGGWVASILTTLPALEPVLTVDAQRLEAALSQLERAHVALPFAGGFRIEARRVVPDYPRAGRKLERTRARAELLRVVRAGERRAVLPTQAVPAPSERDAIDRLVKQAERVAAGDVVLESSELHRSLRIPGAALLSALRVVRAAGAEPTLSLDPEALAPALATARKEVENEARSARFVVEANDKVSITAGEPERRLDLAELVHVALLAASGLERRGPLPLVETAPPALSTEEAARLSIRGLVSQFTTRHPCCERRVENIHRIADLLQGLLVKPGETVSVNAIVGPRTLKNGFVPAPTIEEGEMVETVGGGISQFATTLYNALFYGGYDIIERQPHSYWFPRYPMGHEATLSYPKPDLIFRNDTDAGMLLDLRYTRTSITVRIFGDNGGRRVEAKVSPRQDIVEVPVEILPNAEIAPDEEHVLQSGMIGWSVVVARILHFPDGTRREEKRKVTYRPKARRVEVHPCRVPRGEKGYTGEPCPDPPAEEESESPPEQ